MLHTARRSGTGQKTSTTNRRRHRGASLAAIVLTACGGSDTGAAPVDSHTGAIYGRGGIQLSFSSNAGGPTPRSWEVIVTSFAKHPADQRVFVGVQHGGPRVAAGDQFGELLRQGGKLTCKVPNSQGDLCRSKGACHSRRGESLWGETR